MALGADATFLAALLLFSYTLALAVFVAGVACVWLVYRRDTAGQKTSLVYDLDAEISARFTAIQEACEALASSDRIWHAPEKRARPQKPRANGSVPKTGLQSVEVGRLETPGISANVDIWGIDDGDMKVLFLPEAILLYQQEHYRPVSYESLEVSLSAARLVKEDALYALLRLTGSSGLEMSLQVSDKTAAARFARAFEAEEASEEARKERPRKETSESEGQGRERRSKEMTKTELLECSILGVAQDASMSEITAAYRKLARAYHPDKVEHLAPEVREFAVNKMKEINVAYAELKRRRKGQGVRENV